MLPPCSLAASSPSASRPTAGRARPVVSSQVSSACSAPPLSRPHIVAATIPSLREGVARMLAAAELVPITERVAACRDPTDDKFLELAVNGHADLIISGDGDLLALNPFREVPIVTPAVFVQGAAR